MSQIDFSKLSPEDFWPYINDPTCIEYLSHYDIRDLKFIKDIHHHGNLLSLLEYSEKGNYNYVQFLLDHGKYGQEQKNLALFRALSSDKYKVVQLLLNRRETSWTADKLLIKASKYGSYKTVQALSHEVNEESKERGLIGASLLGKYRIVKLLLQYNVNIHAKQDRALINASGRGHYQIVKLLLENGADPHAQGSKALTAASCMGYQDVIDLLKQYSQQDCGANLLAMLYGNFMKSFIEKMYGM